MFGGYRAAARLSAISSQEPPVHSGIGILPSGVADAQLKQQRARKQQEYRDALSQQIQYKQGAMPAVADSRASEAPEVDSDAEIARLRALRMALQVANAQSELRIRQLDESTAERDVAVRSGPSRAPDKPAVDKADKEKDRDKDTFSFDPRELARQNAAALGVLPSSAPASVAVPAAASPTAATTTATTATSATSAHGLPDWYRRRFGGQGASQSSADPHSAPSLAVAAPDSTAPDYSAAAAAYPMNPHVYAQLAQQQAAQYAQLVAMHQQPQLAGQEQQAQQYMPLPQYQQYQQYQQFPFYVVPSQYYTAAQVAAAQAQAQPSYVSAAEHERSAETDRERGRDTEHSGRDRERDVRSVRATDKDRDRDRDRTPTHSARSASIAAMGTYEEQQKAKAKQQKQAYGQELRAAIAEKEAAKKREKEAEKAERAEKSGSKRESQRDRERDRDRQGDGDRDTARDRASRADYASPSHGHAARPDDAGYARDRPTSAEREWFFPSCCSDRVLGSPDSHAAQLAQQQQQQQRMAMAAMGATMVPAAFAQQQQQQHELSPASARGQYTRANLHRDRFDRPDQRQHGPGSADRHDDDAADRDRDRERERAPPPRTPPAPSAGRPADTQTQAAKPLSGAAAGIRPVSGGRAAGPGMGAEISPIVARARAGVGVGAALGFGGLSGQESTSPHGAQQQQAPGSAHGRKHISPAGAANKRHNEESSIFGPATVQTKITSAADKAKAEAQLAVQAEMRRQAEEAVKAKEERKRQEKEAERKLEEKIKREQDELRRRDEEERSRVKGRRSLGGAAVPASTETTATAAVNSNPNATAIADGAAAVPIARGPGLAATRAREAEAEMEREQRERLSHSRGTARGRASLAPDRDADRDEQPPQPQPQPQQPQQLQQLQQPPLPYAAARPVVNVDDLPAGAKARKIAVQRQLSNPTPPSQSQSGQPQQQQQQQRPLSSHSTRQLPSDAQSQQIPTAPTHTQGSFALAAGSGALGAGSARPDTPQDFPVMRATHASGSGSIPSMHDDDVDREAGAAADGDGDGDERADEPAPLPSGAAVYRPRAGSSQSQSQLHSGHSGQAQPHSGRPRGKLHVQRGDQFFEIDSEDEIPSVHSPMVKNEREPRPRPRAGHGKLRDAHADTDGDTPAYSHLDRPRSAMPRGKVMQTQTDSPRELLAVQQDVLRRNLALKHQMQSQELDQPQSQYQERELLSPHYNPLTYSSSAAAAGGQPTTTAAANRAAGRQQSRPPTASATDVRRTSGIGLGLSRLGFDYPRGVTPSYAARAQLGESTVAESLLLGEPDGDGDGDGEAEQLSMLEPSTPGPQADTAGVGQSRARAGSGTPLLKGNSTFILVEEEIPSPRTAQALAKVAHKPQPPKHDLPAFPSRSLSVPSPTKTTTTKPHTPYNADDQPAQSAAIRARVSPAKASPQKAASQQQQRPLTTTTTTTTAAASSPLSPGRGKLRPNTSAATATPATTATISTGVSLRSPTKSVTAQSLSADTIRKADDGLALLQRMGSVSGGSAAAVVPESLTASTSAATRLRTPLTGQSQSQSQPQTYAQMRQSAERLPTQQQLLQQQQERPRTPSAPVPSISRSTSRQATPAKPSTTLSVHNAHDGANVEDAEYQDDFELEQEPQEETELDTGGVQFQKPDTASSFVSASLAARAPSTAMASATATAETGGSGRPPRPRSSRFEDPETAKLIAASEQYTARLKAEFGQQRWQDMARLYSPDFDSASHAKKATGRQAVPRTDDVDVDVVVDGEFEEDDHVQTGAAAASHQSADFD